MIPILRPGLEATNCLIAEKIAFNERALSTKILREALVWILRGTLQLMCNEFVIKKSEGVCRPLLPLLGVGAKNIGIHV